MGELDAAVIVVIALVVKQLVDLTKGTDWFAPYVLPAISAFLGMLVSAGFAIGKQTADNWSNPEQVAIYAGLGFAAGLAAVGTHEISKTFQKRQEVNDLWIRDMLREDLNDQVLSELAAMEQEAKQREAQQPRGPDGKFIKKGGQDGGG